MEGSDLRAPLQSAGGASPSRVAISLSNASQKESAKCSVMSLARLSAFSSLSRSPEEAVRRSTASCNSRQSARWRRSAPSRSAADFRALAVCWFIPASSRLAGEHDGLPTVRGLVVAKDVDGTVIPADLEVAVVGAVPAIDDLEHLDAAAAQFEPAWGLLAAVAGVAVDVDVHGAQRATGMGRRSCCRPWRIRPARRGELRAYRQGARRRPCGLCPRPTRARVVGCWDKTHGPVGHTSDLHRSAQPGYTGAVARDRHYIAVVGAGACEPEVARVAEEVGRLVARAGAVLVCGGLGGVMEAACRGARAEGGTTVGAAGAWHGRGLVCYARSSAGRKRRVGRTPIIGPTVMAPRKAYETGQP